VAKGDGSHEFSRTLDEHNRAVNLYQRRRDKDTYRSSPAPKNGPAPKQGAASASPSKRNATAKERARHS